MIQILDDSRVKKTEEGDLIISSAKYYCINKISKQHGFAFSHKEDLEEWIKDECIHYNIKKEELETGKISDREDLKIVPISVCGGNIRETESK